MKRTFLLSAFAAALFVAQATQAQLKPVVVVSISSASELMDDAKWLSTLTGGAGDLPLAMVQQQLTAAGVDATKPAGAVYGLQDGQWQGMGFVPATNLDALGALAGGVEDGPDGTKKIGQMFVKLQDGYAFVAPSPDMLATPVDPVKIVAELGKKYDVAASVNLQAVPELLKTTGLAFAEVAAMGSIEKNEGETDEQFGYRKALLEENFKLVKQMAVELDTVTIGVSMDRTEKKLLADFSFTARPGSEIAAQFAMYQNAQTRFGDLVRPDAAISMNSTINITDQKTIEQSVAQLTAYRKVLDATIDQSPEVESDEERAIFKELVGDLMDVVESIYQEGRIDVAAALLQESGGPFRLVAGMHVGKAKALETFTKKLLAQLMEAEETFPPVKFNADSHKGAAIHSITLPVQEGEEEQVEKVVGAAPKLYLAFSADAAWLALGGGDALDALKKVIDGSDATQTKPVNPSELSVALRPFIQAGAQFGQADMVATLLEAAPVGTDRIRLTGEAVENGVRYRFQIEEGVLKVLSQAAKLAAEARASENAVDDGF